MTAECFLYLLTKTNGYDIMNVKFQRNEGEGFMEREISRIETTRKITTIFKYLAYAFVAFGALSLIAVVVVASMDDAWEYVFKDTSYTIPIIIVFTSAILAVLFFVMDKRTGSVISFLVLTNRRLYNQIETPKLKQIESYNLNKITHYSIYQTITKKGTRFTLKFKTSTDTVKFIVDEEFYNEFVNAVSATVSVIE